MGYLVGNITIIRFSICVCVENACIIIVIADFLFFFSFFLVIASSNYFTLPPKSTLASPVCKQARSN